MIVGIDKVTRRLEIVFDWAESISEVNAPPEYDVLNAPSEVDIGWVYDGGEFRPDVIAGMEYDYQTRRYFSHAEYRAILHARTDSDVMQALRKLREGDTSHDWQAWLDLLDAYNADVTATKEQESYPESVRYPSYPVRPWEAE